MIARIKPERAAFSAGWLDQLNPSLAGAIVSACSAKSASNGHVVYDFGNEQSHLWGVASGCVRMFLQFNERAPQFGHICGPGFWFGESEFVTGQPAIMRTVASGDVQLARISRSAFEKLVSSHPDAWRAVAQLAICNQATAVAAAEDLMIRDPMCRLVAVLLRLASHRNAYQGVDPIHSVPVSQEELSLAANMSRSSGAQLLADLNQRGWINTEYRSIRIVAADALHELMKRRPE